MRDQEETETAYIKRRLSEAVDEEALDAISDQLREEGYASEKVRPRKSERRKELLKHQKSSTAVTRTGGQRSAEDIIENLSWPVSLNGEVDPVFVAGMRYEAMNVIRGIRMAQELNKMGLEQAKPVIEMAKEMRAAEGQAAQMLAGQFGQITVESNNQILQAIQSLASAQPRGESGNPALQAFFTAAQPFLGQIFQRMFASFSGMGQQPGQVQPQPPASVTMPGQNQTAEPDTPPVCLRPGEEGEFREL